MNMLNYIVTAQKSSSVTHSCVGCFTGPCNLILGICSRLEIHRLSAQGLEPVLELPIYGRISVMHLFRPKNGELDVLFVLTEERTYFVLAWDAQVCEVITRASGDLSIIKGRHPSILSGRRKADNWIAAVNPFGSLIGLHLYKEYLEVIPIKDKGELEDPFHIRLQKGKIIDFKFLYTSKRPTIAALYEINKGSQHVRVYHIDMKDKCLLRSFVLKELHRGADLCGAYFLIPVASPLGGVLIKSDNAIVYSPANGSRAWCNSLEIRSTMRAYGVLDAAVFKYVLGADDGSLFLLDIKLEYGKFSGLHIATLGRTSIASTISCSIENNLIYISSYGRSQLFKLDVKDGCVKEFECFPNEKPVVDFGLTMEDLVQKMPCYGIENALCIVRPCMTLDEMASHTVLGICGMWALQSSSSSTESYDSFIVVSFDCETKILKVNGNCLLEFTDMSGFNYDRRTLFCFAAITNQVVQVTESSTILLGKGGLLHEWSPLKHGITVATGTTSQLLLATGSQRLSYLEVFPNCLKCLKSVQIDHTVSCLDMNLDCQIAAVGLWNKTVRIYSLPGLEMVAATDLGGQTVPRSILFCYLEEVSYLLCGLADGFIVEFILDSKPWLLEYRKMSVGSTAETLTFSSRNKCIFVTGEKPTIIYSNFKKLEYSLLNMGELTYVTPFSSVYFSDGLAYSTPVHFGIALIRPNIQSIHMNKRKVVRCICHHKQDEVFGLCTSEDSMYSVELMDEKTFMLLSDTSYRLRDHELPLSIISCCFNGDEDEHYICVGSGFGQCEKKEGAIHIFGVENKKNLKLHKRITTEGYVFSLCASMGKLAVAMADHVILYECRVFRSMDESGCFDNHVHATIEPICKIVINSCLLHLKSCGDGILVGDIGWANFILRHLQTEPWLKKESCELKQTLSTAMEMITNDLYVCADHNYNLTMFRRSDDLQVVDRETVHVTKSLYGFHVGDQILQFRKTYVSKCSEPSMLFSTANGSICLFASLPNDLFDRLKLLQQHMLNFTRGVGVGGLSYFRWRSSQSNILDGDLIESFIHLRHHQMRDVILEGEKEDLALNERVNGFIKDVAYVTYLKHSYETPCLPDHNCGGSINNLSFSNTVSLLRRHNPQ